MVCRQYARDGISEEVINSSNSTAFFEVKNLWVHYGGVAALKGVSLDIGKGAVVAVIGANGAGKSTLLRVISGLNRPSQGEIRLEGRKIDELSPDMIVAAGIAHVPEGRRLFPEMSVLENLRMGAYMRKDQKEVVADLESIYLHFPVLKERKGQPAGTLSGGEQQMLAISRALMARPALLLLDEPSMGLSPIMVAEIAKIVCDINTRLKITILLVEQNARMALSLASKAYVLQTGTVFRQGEASSLMNDEELKKAYLGA
jgi:branched-chain amino acid transport system ATP-binding protein